MSKLTVYRYDKHNLPVEAEGWFTPENAEALPEADPMTAERHKQARRRGESVRGVKETLYRTEEGRWVLKIAWHLGPGGEWVDEEADATLGDPPRYRFLGDAEAMGWLTLNHYDG